MYKIVVENGFVVALGEGIVGETISKNEYDNLIKIFSYKPKPKMGYDYFLKSDSLTWELVELPTEPETEPTEEDKAAAYDIIVSGITEKETLKPLEIAKKIKEIVDKYYKG